MVILPVGPNLVPRFHRVPTRFSTMRIANYSIIQTNWSRSIRVKETFLFRERLSRLSEFRCWARSNDWEKIPLPEGIEYFLKSKDSEEIKFRKSFQVKLADFMIRYERTTIDKKFILYVERRGKCRILFYTNFYFSKFSITFFAYLFSRNSVEQYG